MNRSLSVSFVFITLFAFSSNLAAQRRNSPSRAKFPAAKKGVIVDERLAVLRESPSLYAESVQRLRRGREVIILQTREADGVTFYRVSAPPSHSGWIQAEALIGTFQSGGDERLARLVQASDGFDRIERAAIFLNVFPDSSLRPPLLLLFGDLMEETAAQLSKDATRKLTRREMAASGAPLHSFYLNYANLDRYRKLGVIFLLNAATKNFHYDGATWRELTKKFPKSPEAAEAQKRLDALREKLERRD